MKPYASYKPSGVAWLGDVPSHWASKRLKHIGQFRAGAGFPIEEQGQPDNPLPFFKVKDIDGSNQGGVITTADSTVSIETANRLGAKIFPKNSIVFAKVGAALLLNRFRLLGVDACVDNNMMGYMINADEAFPEFMYWAMQRINFSEIVNPGTVPSLNEPLISNLFMAIPPPDEQQAIADYLDAETARIDTLVQEKEELIGLLREWRQSVIAEYTSGATQPHDKKATGNVHMPWIPSDWSMVRLGKYARIGNGSTPLKDNASYWEGGTFPWLNSAVVNRDTVDEGSEYVTDAALRACHLPIVEPGALLVALTGQGKTRGQVTVLRIQATINQHLAYLALDDARFDSHFLFWALTGMYAALRMVSDGQGGTKGALTCDDLARFEVPMPPLALQREIAKAVSNEATKIDALITHTQEEIALLKELRAATIADAVLGRVDVRSLTQKQ